MESEDPNAVWIMQGWLFSYSDFWQEPQIKAILSGAPQGSMIILDLDSTYREQYSRTQGYFGLQPFIFNDLSNFGGGLGLFGRLDNINQRPFEARKFNMIGTGFTPEGLTDSYISTELMSEMSWRQVPVANQTFWIQQYLERRYGIHNQEALQAWSILAKHVLNSKTDHFNQKVLLTLIPNLDRTDFTWYPFSEVVEAFDWMVLAVPELQHEPGFQ